MTTPTNPAPTVCGTIKARADLIRDALRFAYLAAGEGIEIDGLAPEDFLMAYSDATGDEDWDTLADRIAAIQPASARPVAASAVRYRLEWLAGARPPAHPEPMKGSAAFDTKEDALAFFSRQADDAKLLSLTRIETFTTNTDALTIGNADGHSPVAGDAVSVREAARVLVRAWEADTLPVENPDPMLPAFIAALRALGGETA